MARYAPKNNIRRLLFRLGGVRVGPFSKIARRVFLEPGVSINDHTLILQNARIEAGAIIGKSCIIQQGVSIESQVEIGNNVVIGQNAVLRNCTIGDNTSIEYGVVCAGDNKNRISIGRFCYIGIYTVLDNTGGIEIGDGVHIAGPAAGIWTHSSVFQCLAGDRIENPQKKVVASVIINNNVWIGGGTTIYPGVKVEHHSVILSNSCVNKDIPSFSMAGGVPVQIKKRIRINGAEISFTADRDER